MTRNRARAATPIERTPSSLAARFSGEARRAFYNALYCIVSVALAMVFPVRVTGGNVIPRRGGFLLVANHASYLDPPLLGLTCYRRRLHFLAMEGLFQFPPFRWFILALGAIKIDRKTSAASGIKAALRHVGMGEGVVIFPEGTRTATGEMEDLKPGVLLLMRRAKSPIVIAGIAGGYQSWSLHRLLPIPKPLWVHYQTWRRGEGADDEAALADLRKTMLAAYAVAERGWRRIGGRPSWRDFRRRRVDSASRPATVDSP